MSAPPWEGMPPFPRPAHQCPGSPCPQRVPREVPAVDGRLHACGGKYLVPGMCRGLCLQVEQEVALHSCLRHRNIVAFHGHFADRDHMYILLEYCSHQVPVSPPSPIFCAHLLTPMSISTYLFLPVPTPGPSVLTLGFLDLTRLTCVHLCLIYSVVPRLISYSSVVTWIHLRIPVLTCVPPALSHAPCPQLNLVVPS